MEIDKAGYVDVDLSISDTCSLESFLREEALSSHVEGQPNPGGRPCFPPSRPGVCVIGPRMLCTR